MTIRDSVRIRHYCLGARFHFARLVALAAMHSLPLFAVPPYYVNLSDRASSVAAFDPNNTSTFTGTNVNHTSATGFLQQFSGTTGDTASSSLNLPDAIPSPIDDGTSLPVLWQAAGNASASGIAQMGSLHAYASASQALTPFSLSYVEMDNDGVTQTNSAVNPLIAEGVGDVDVSSQDQITLQSSTLTNGTFVQIRVGLAVQSAVDAVGAGSYAQVSAQAYCHVHFQFQDYDTDSLNFNSQLNGNSAAASETFSAPVGATVYFIQSLSADVSVSSYVGPGYPLSAKPPLSSAIADASDTAHFYLDVLDSRASLSAISGHNYSSPSPNPVLSLTPSGGTNLLLTTTTTPLQSWVLQVSSDLASWTDTVTNSADGSGHFSLNIPFNFASPSKFFRLRAQ